MGEVKDVNKNEISSGNVRSKVKQVYFGTLVVVF